jgi:hypothetical protein
VFPQLGGADPDDLAWQRVLAPLRVVSLCAAKRAADSCRGGRRR